MSGAELRVNGERVRVAADPGTPLVYVLRNELGLTGTKLGCSLEQCGACAVLVDGEPVMSCTLTVEAVGRRPVVTVEGLAAGGAPNAVQRALVVHRAAQCGFCTPGIAIALTALLARDPHPDREAIEAALTPHLCRCGTHARVVRAALAAAAQSREAAP